MSAATVTTTAHDPAPTRARGTGGVSAFLAACIVASIPLPPLFTLTSGNQSAPVIWPMVFTALGLVNAGIGALLKKSPRVDLVVPAVAGVFVVLMAIPAMFSPAGLSGWLAYINFAVGICAGVLVGRAWAQRNLARITIIDVAVMIFVFATVVQLLTSFSGASGLEALHQNSQTSWGNSNYVAGALAVTGVLLLARSTFLQKRYRLFLYVTIGVAFVIAVLTLSRGGTLAIAVGVAATLCLLPKTTGGRFVGVALSAGAIFLVYKIIDLIEAQRLLVNSQVSENVDTRFTMWGLAWNDFLNNTVTGSGWASFRAITAPTIVGQQTFAHNIFFSYLQMGGLLFGATFLIALVALSVRAARNWLPIVPVLLAILTISLTDPFTEGTIGGMLTWTALAFALPKRTPADE